MPKQKGKNAFYYFMLNFKEEQKRNGVKYESMAEVAEAASFHWENAPSTVRAKYIDIAKKEKENKVSNDELPLNLQEQPIGKDERELQDIGNIVRLLCSSEVLLQEDFYLMDVNVFCKISNGIQYLIAESTVLRFSLKEGLKDQYHELINPGKIPVGYTYEAKLGSKDIGLELPDERQKKSNYITILANVMEYLKKPNTNRRLPPLYTLPDKVIPITNFIQQMCSQASEDPNIFRVYRLDTLFYKMVNAIKSRPEEGFVRPAQALAKLTNDTYKFFTPGMGCEVHHIADKTIECTTSRVKSWAYKVLDLCCPMLQIEKKLISHVPSDDHLDDIHIFGVEPRNRAGASAVGMYAMQKKSSSRNTSVVSASASEATTADIPEEQKRKYEPVRMPKTTYTRSYIAPDFDDNFGLGRGRGLCSSFDNMRINK